MLRTMTAGQVPTAKGSQALPQPVLHASGRYWIAGARLFPVLAGAEDADPADDKGSAAPDAGKQADPSGSQEPKKEPATYTEDYVKQLRAENASYRKRATDAEGKVKEHDDAKLSETERAARQAKEATDEATAVKTELRQERARNAILTVAAEKQIPLKLAERLLVPEFGDDGKVNTAALAKSADDLLKEYPQLVADAGGSTSATNGARGGAGQSDDEKLARQLIYGTSADAFDPKQAAALGGGVIISQKGLAG